MSASAARATGGRAKAPGGHNPWIVALVVALATFMEVLDTTIANVALRYISGALAVGPDESAWVVTSYLVANAKPGAAPSGKEQTICEWRRPQRPGPDHQVIF